jgi:hypothetical protein
MTANGTRARHAKKLLSARGPSTHDLGINNADNCRIGKRLANLPKLREIGFPANRWLLEVERLSHQMHSRRGRINRPITLNGQRARLPLCRSAPSPRCRFRPHPRDDRARGNDQFRHYASTARSSASPAIASPTPVSEPPSSSREPNRLLRPTPAVVLPSHHAAATLLKRSFDTPDTRIIEWLAQTNLAGQT